MGALEKRGDFASCERSECFMAALPLLHICEANASLSRRTDRSFFVATKKREKEVVICHRQSIGIAKQDLGRPELKKAPLCKGSSRRSQVSGFSLQAGTCSLRSLRGRSPVSKAPSGRELDSRSED